MSRYLAGGDARIAERNPLAFANEGETLFDAIDHVAVDFEGTTAVCGAGGCDLSGFVVGEEGTSAKWGRWDSNPGPTD